MIVEFAKYKTTLKDLYNFLKSKGLSVKYYKRGDRKINGTLYRDVSETIYGSDFIIGIVYDYYEKKRIENEVYVDYISELSFNEFGVRCGGWKKKEFKLYKSEFDAIYDFVKDIALKNDTKKYNL